LAICDHRKNSTGTNRRQVDSLSRPRDPAAEEDGMCVPGIHVFVVAQDVDGRDTGERKRRRSSNGYARP
jgi:hypothetical protein